MLQETVTRVKDEETPEEEPGRPSQEEAAPAGTEADTQTTAADTKTTAAAAAVAGFVGLLSPAVAGPLAVAGGPVLGLGVAGAVAYGAAYRPEGDAFGDFSRDLGRRAQHLSCVAGRKGAEVAGRGVERLQGFDERHDLSGQAQRAGRKALSDVQDLTKQTTQELKLLLSGWVGTRSHEAAAPAAPAAAAVPEPANASAAA